MTHLDPAQNAPCKNKEYAHKSDDARDRGYQSRPDAYHLHCFRRSSAVKLSVIHTANTVKTPALATTSRPLFNQ